MIEYCASGIDTICVNDRNNPHGLKHEGETPKGRLIEEDIRKLMWNVKDM